MSSPISGEIVPESPLPEKTATESPIQLEIVTESGEKYRILRHNRGFEYTGLNITHEDNGEDEQAWKDTNGSGVVAIYLEPVDKEHPWLHGIVKDCESLDGLPGIPFVHCTGTVDEFHYAVVDLLGPTLEDLFTYCGRKFSLKTILILADQLLCRMESLHSESRVHRHFGPDSVAMGVGKFGNVSYLVDIIRCDYISGQSSDADAPSRDDLFRANLFALGHVLVHFARPKLSWEELRSKPVEEICHGLPVEFLIYFNYVRDWCFDEKPNYSLLRRIFYGLFRYLGFQEDYVFDWTVVKYQKAAEEKAKEAEKAEKAKPFYSSLQSTFDEIFRHMRSNKNHLIAWATRRSQRAAEKANGDEENLMPSTDIGPQNPWVLALQPQTRAISQAQLVAESRGIHAGLRMVDAKCVDVHIKEAAKALNSRQCLAMFELHRAYLFSDYDLFLASQHPNASPALQKVASNLKLATRMFQHAMQPCLDIFRANSAGKPSTHLSFLRLSYSMATTLYETVPKLKPTWVELLYALAQAFKDAEPKKAATWKKRIQFWQSQRDPAVGGILQLDVSGGMPEDLFAPPDAKPCSIESAMELLSEKPALAQHDGLSEPQFTQNSPPERPYSLLATFRYMAIFIATVLLSSCYILRHENQVITWGLPELQALTLDPIYSNLIPDFSFAYFVGLWLILVCALASFHRRSRLDRYQTLILALAGITGTVIACGFGISVDLIISGVIPSALLLGMILSSIGHLVGRQYRERTGRIKLEDGDCMV